MNRFPVTSPIALCSTLSVSHRSTLPRHSIRKVPINPLASFTSQDLERTIRSGVLTPQRTTGAGTKTVSAARPAPSALSRAHRLYLGKAPLIGWEGIAGAFPAALQHLACLHSFVLLEEGPGQVRHSHGAPAAVLFDR